jgi:hypothetical protein
MKLAVITAHAGADSLWDALASWHPAVTRKISGDKWETYFNREGLVREDYVHALVEDGRDGMLPAYQRGFLVETADILAFLHDDTIINDPEWAHRVLAEFEDPTVGLVGFGGALGHGYANMYHEPYDYHHLGRYDFMSNMVDAENHGKRLTGACDVAVLDGFALIVRWEVLEKAGGWPLNTPIGYIAYDYWLSCMTRRLGYRIRLVGVACHHLGGRTFVKLAIGQDPQHWQKYLDAHRYIYDEFKDVLPFRVGQR